MKILNKAILLVLVILIVLALPISVGAQEIDVNVPTYTMVGDMDGDEQLKAADLVLLQKAILGVPLQYNTRTADMNKDGKINIKDLVALKQELSKPTDSGGSGDIYFPGHW
ncbi:MAG: dockerin type I repeat-containing protein [Clostridia bacterium]|nr:dockerin type I repeat-containing protein [Clostridia bacterium]MEE1185053.1 dockerin type I repeat-containing protein [Acutalibacteraceae bacterium]